MFLGVKHFERARRLELLPRQNEGSVDSKSDRNETISKYLGDKKHDRSSDFSYKKQGHHPKSPVGACKKNISVFDRKMYKKD